MNAANTGFKSNHFSLLRLTPNVDWYFREIGRVRSRGVVSRRCSLLSEEHGRINHAASTRRAGSESVMPSPICPARSRRSVNHRPRRCTTSPASIR